MIKRGIPQAAYVIAIENVTAGLRGYGYRVLTRPLPGEERAYYDHLRRGLQKVEKFVDYLHQNRNCRGKSKRTLSILHRSLPDPAWGVVAPEDCSKDH